MEDPHTFAGPHVVTAHVAGDALFPPWSESGFESAADDDDVVDDDSGALESGLAGNPATCACGSPYHSTRQFVAACKEGCRQRRCTDLGPRTVDRDPDGLFDSALVCLDARRMAVPAVHHGYGTTSRSAHHRRRHRQWAEDGRAADKGLRVRVRRSRDGQTSGCLKRATEKRNTRSSARDASIATAMMTPGRLKPQGRLQDWRCSATGAGLPTAEIVCHRQAPACQTGRTVPKPASSASHLRQRQVLSLWRRTPSTPACPPSA